MLSRNELRELRQRWTESETKKAIDFLIGKSSHPPDHPVDLRGLVITSFIKDRQLKNLDLTACKFERFGQFGFCRCEDCKFSYAELGTNLGRQFLRCDFEHAVLRGAVLRGEFYDCNFDSAHLNGASGSSLHFCRCSFKNVDFRRAILLNCTFEECVLKQCTFGDGSLGNVKFAKTQPIECEFQNTILDGATYT